MPISFSAWCIISLVMRGAGVGDGEGRGVGDGVCASASSGNFDTARPVAPRAGSSLTKVRLPTFLLLARVFSALFFFMVIGSPGYLFIGTIVPVPTPCVLGFPYFCFTTFAFPNR